MRTCSEFNVSYNHAVEAQAVLRVKMLSQKQQKPDFLSLRRAAETEQTSREP